MDSFIRSIVNLHQTTGVEGYAVPEQAAELMAFLNANPDIKTVGEIGFNVGMSSACMLDARPDIKIISFDLGAHGYVLPQKHIIDSMFPNRHTLIIGDSTMTVPQFFDLVKEPIFDFMFVDGGHIHPVPYKDIKNSLPLVKPGGYICVDDYNLTYGNEGVIHGYDTVRDEGLIEHIDVKHARDRSWVYCRKK